MPLDPIVLNAPDDPSADNLYDAFTKVNANDTYIDGRINTLNGEKGVSNGIATLDASGLVPAGQLPSYVDDVLEYANQASFPGTGETGKIYIAIDTGTSYRWTGSVYVEISSTMTGADIKSLYEAEPDTNVFTDAEKTKLAGIEDGATAGGGGGSTTPKTQFPYPEVGVEKLTQKRHPVSGKPVYTQAYNIADMGTAYDGTIAHGLTGIEDYSVIDFVLGAQDASNFSISQASSMYTNDSSEFRVQMDNTNLYYYMSDASFYNNSSLLITIEYCKTADTASSPVASLVPVSPEVGVEKVTGRYHPANGKPIYTQAYYIADIGTTYDGSIPTGLTGLETYSVTSSEVILSGGASYSGEISYWNTDNSQHGISMSNQANITYNFADIANYNNCSVLAIIEYTKLAD